MDMITLAMAKKYTDEKCGGSSGGGLPVVEIADTSAITAEEGAKLTACIGMPCVIKDDRGALVCSYVYDGMHVFIDTTQTLFISTDGITWMLGEL